jgi:glycosyltransferase involved in cell wall biosynthesis
MVTVVDDRSDDGTWEIIQKYKIHAIRNDKHNGSGLENIYNGILGTSTELEDIIVTVDGDDWLAGIFVLSHLNRVYSDDVWLTYGSFLPVSGGYQNTCQPLSSTHTFDDYGRAVHNSLNSRSYRKSGALVTSHLRTFKRGLWDKINIEDLKDESGKFYLVAWDLAFMYPMIEMAGSHVKFIDRVLYFYNDLNPNCDGTICPEKQIKTGEKIQAKPNYNEL